MKRINSLLSAGVTLTSSGTAVAAPIPLDSAGYFPRFVRVVATGAGCFVKVGDIGVTAVSGDCMIQPLDGTVLNVRGCKAISAISVSGTSSVTVVPLEAGSWNYDQRTLDYNFTTLSAVPSTVTFTRGSSGTFFGSDGLLKVQGYNLLTQSVDLTNGAWGKSNCTVTGSDPSFLVTTSGLSHNVTNGTGGAFGVTVTPSTQYTFTFYAKRGTMTDVKYSVYNITGAANIIAPTSYYSQINSDTETRITVSFTTPVGCTSINCFLLRDSGVTGTVYLGKPQLEAGSTATQYSPTTTAANSAPRLDYDPATLLPRGLLVEEQRTNIALYSQDMANAFWGGVSGGSTVQSDQTVAPDGTTTGDQITSGNAASNAIYNGTNITVAASTQYTYSFYAKLGTMAAASHKFAVYDATGLAFIGADLVPSTAPTSTGWTRVSYTFTTPVGCLALRVYPFRNTAAVSGTVFIWGQQVEAGSFPTSYIPTTTASATRSADSASMTGTNFSSWYNQTQGTFVVEFDRFGFDNVAGSAVLVQADDNSTSNRVALRLGVRSAAAQAQSTIVAGGSILINEGLGTAASIAGLNVKAALAYQVGVGAVGRSGEANNNTSIASLPTTTQLNIAQGPGAAALNGHVRRIQYYPTRLSNATLQTLTA